jgi:AcrR family transcriptional regulator
MVYKLNRRPSQRQHLFETAAGLVSQEGISALTIDNLAKAAGMTKGGVQYHFESKAKLETELLEWLLSSFDTALQEETKGIVHGKAWLRTYVTLSATPAGEDDHAALALLMSFPPGDARAEPFTKFAQKWREAAVAGVSDTALAHIIRLAADSMWLERLDKTAGDSATKAIADRLLAMVETLE